MRNYDFIALSPVKEPKIVRIDEEGPLVDKENAKFKIKPQPAFDEVT